MDPRTRIAAINLLQYKEKHPDVLESMNVDVEMIHIQKGCTDEKGGKQPCVRQKNI